MARIAITGSTGPIGEALYASLVADGHHVQRVVRARAAAGPQDVFWDLDRGVIDAARLEGVDAVVHLAGEPIGAARWTQATKRAIRVSRRVGTDLIARTLASLRQPPPVLVSASAVGIYGDRGDEILTEESPSGDDFVAEVCALWEASADPARDAGIRVVHPRTGVVTAPGGPLLEKLERPFKLGVGGKVASGRQYVPWISLPDHIRALRWLIDHDDMQGPVNLVGPTPTTNEEMAKALGRVLRRPAVLPIPAFAIRLIYGTMGETLATGSQRAIPKKLQEAGFSFEHQDIEAALRDGLGRRAPAA